MIGCVMPRFSASCSRAMSTVSSRSAGRVRAFGLDALLEAGARRDHVDLDLGVLGEGIEQRLDQLVLARAVDVDLVGLRGGERRRERERAEQQHDAAMKHESPPADEHVRRARLASSLGRGRPGNNRNSFDRSICWKDSKLAQSGIDQNFGAAPCSAAWKSRAGTRRSLRSPHGAKRNAGSGGERPVPDFASLHPGCKCRSCLRCAAGEHGRHPGPVDVLPRHDHARLLAAERIAFLH